MLKLIFLATKFALSFFIPNVTVLASVAERKLRQFGSSAFNTSNPSYGSRATYFSKAFFMLSIFLK